jgi:hypothetical protein
MIICVGKFIYYIHLWFRPKTLKEMCPKNNNTQLEEKQ